MMTDTATSMAIDGSTILHRYLATWNAVGDERHRLLDTYWSSQLTYTDPLAEVSGPAELSGLIGAVQGQFAGYVFTALGEPDTHHRQLRFTWGLGPADEEPVVIGFDVVVLDEDGRIRDVRGFLDRVPA